MSGSSMFAERMPINGCRLLTPTAMVAETGCAVSGANNPFGATALSVTSL